MTSEINFDGLVGPTHNYSGLSYGNLASTAHENARSHPKKAALQGLEKMKFLHDLGVPQAVLPPQPRPHLETLRALGLEIADSPLFRKLSSASAMWAANSATVTPSADTKDGRVHITPANLVSLLHRSIEADTTYALLQKIFKGHLFVVHPPLPKSLQTGDEGAANHTHLCPDYGKPGIHIFTYGKKGSRFPARQTREASEAIARTHQIKRALFFEQNPEAIDAGVFHNDVTAVGNKNLFLFHEKAYVNQEEEIAKLKDFGVTCIEIKEKDLSLKEAVATYFFNSQLVTLPGGETAIIAPIECQSRDALLKTITPHVHYVNVKESMSNGGGPACLRLRVVLTAEEKASLHQGVLFTDALYLSLKRWIEKHYRDTLTPEQLADPLFIQANNEALAELMDLLHL